MITCNQSITEHVFEPVTGWVKKVTAVLNLVWPLLTNYSNLVYLMSNCIEFQAHPFNHSTRNADFK